MASKKQQAKIDAVATTESALTDLQRGFRAKKSEERQRYQDATDSEFWVALCFETRAQKEEFLSKIGVLTMGDKYLDGREVAAAMNIEIESPRPDLKRTYRQSTRMNDLIRR